MHTLSYTHIHTHTFCHTHIHTHTHTLSYSHTRCHTHIHTHTHTHTHKVCYPPLCSVILLSVAHQEISFFIYVSGCLSLTLFKHSSSGTTLPPSLSFCISFIVAV